MKQAFFTGATGGLGELCVRAMAESGDWTVFAAGTNAERLEALGKLGNVIPIRMDVTDQKSVDAALEFVRARTDRMDAVVNFAGLVSFSSLVEGDCVSGIERLLDVNVLGMARVNRAFFELVLAGRGRIVNCSSESGWMTPQPFSGPYALSKYAVEAYSDSLRRELMYLGIPVIKLQPGNYKTQLTQRILDGFNRTQAESRYYGPLLENMRPLMLNELTRDNDPRRLVKIFLKALNSRHPKIRYSVGTGKQLLLLELIPDKLLDRIYLLFYRRKAK
jgi:NAD(P)-dependent dehydrogenase (short-subunit alcohol dehydrogenase family)